MYMADEFERKAQRLQPSISISSLDNDIMFNSADYNDPMDNDARIQSTVNVSLTTENASSWSQILQLLLETYYELSMNSHDDHRVNKLTNKVVFIVPSTVNMGEYTAVYMLHIYQDVFLCEGENIIILYSFLRVQCNIDL